MNSVYYSVSHEYLLEELRKYFYYLLSIFDIYTFEEKTQLFNTMVIVYQLILFYDSYGCFYE